MRVDKPQLCVSVGYEGVAQIYEWLCSLPFTGSPLPHLLSFAPFTNSTCRDCGVRRDGEGWIFDGVSGVEGGRSGQAALAYKRL